MRHLSSTKRLFSARVDEKGRRNLLPVCSIILAQGRISTRDRTVPLHRLINTSIPQARSESHTEVSHPKSNPAIFTPASLIVSHPEPPLETHNQANIPYLVLPETGPGVGVATLLVDAFVVTVAKVVFAVVLMVVAGTVVGFGADATGLFSQKGEALPCRETRSN